MLFRDEQMLLRASFALLYKIMLVIGVIGFLAPQISQAQSAQKNSYPLQPGDVVSISVFGEPDLSLVNVRIPTNSILSYPLIGELPVINDTVQSLEQKIRIRLLDGYLLDPQVSVSVLSYRPVYIGGAVSNPGAIEFSDGMNVEKVIALAGGILEESDMSAITLQRQIGGEPKEAVVVFATEVHPGDVITVPKLKKEILETKYIYLDGEVRTPGKYEFSENLTVEKAIVEAGGFSSRASKRKITISRETDPPTKIKRAKLNVILQPGDVVTIGASLF